MKLPLSAEQLAALKAFLVAFEDSEALSESEYVLDLYDLDPPLSMDLKLGRNCLFVDGAAELRFNEELDGWYIYSNTTNLVKIIIHQHYNSVPLL